MSNIGHLGAADSFDGSKWARWRKTYLPTALAWLDEAVEAREVALAAPAIERVRRLMGPSFADRLARLTGRVHSWTLMFRSTASPKGPA